MDKKITRDFRKFSPKYYLNDYFLEEDNEGKYLLRFYHKVYNSSSGVSRLLEVGGGPTIYQLISASAVTDQIIFSEYLDDNRKEITKWIKGSRGAFNWDKYFRFVLQLEGKKCSQSSLREIKRRLRDKIKAVIFCDVLKNNVLKTKKYKIFDAVSINFCSESITDNEKDFILSLRNITALLKENGLLVMTLLKNAKYYKVGEVKFCSFPVNERYIKKVLPRIGYSDIKIKSYKAEPERPYNGFICLTAKKIKSI